MDKMLAAGEHNPVVVLPLTVAWQAGMKLPKHRSEIHLVFALSKSGKTEYGIAIFDNPFICDFGQHGTFPDSFRFFDEDQYDGIVVDEVHDVQHIVNHQNAFQGHWKKEFTFASTSGGTCEYTHRLRVTGGLWPRHGWRLCLAPAAPSPTAHRTQPAPNPGRLPCCAPCGECPSSS